MILLVWGYIKMINKNQIRAISVIIGVISLATLCYSAFKHSYTSTILSDIIFVSCILSLIYILNKKPCKKNKLKTKDDLDNILRNVIDNSPNLIYYKDLNQKFTGCNDALCKYFGMAEEEVIGKKLDYFFTGEEKHKIESYEALAISTKKSQEYNIEITANGKTENFHVIKSPLLDINNNVFGTSTICVKITEEVLAKKGKELYIEALSHDIKTPVLAQYKALNQLKSGVLGELNEDQLLIVNQICSSCKFTEEMLNAHISTFRHRLLKHNFTPETFNISEIIDAHLDKIQPMLLIKDLEIIRDIQPNIIMDSDKKLISRLFTNTIFNAVTFAADGTNVIIKINTLDDNNTLKFTINNYGYLRQFAEEDLMHLFDKFVITKEKFRPVGAWIGLHLVYEAVKFVNGKINLKMVDSENDKLDKYQLDITLPINSTSLKDKVFYFK